MKLLWVGSFTSSLPYPLHQDTVNSPSSLVVLDLLMVCCHWTIPNLVKVLILCIPLNLTPSIPWNSASYLDLQLEFDNQGKLHTRLLIFHIWTAIYHLRPLMECIFHNLLVVLETAHIIMIFSSSYSTNTKITSTARLKSSFKNFYGFHHDLVEG